MTTTPTTQAQNGAELDLQQLKALALAYEYENSGVWYSIHQLADGITYEPAANFVVAASPAVVLDLIARIERATAPHAANIELHNRIVQRLAWMEEGKAIDRADFAEDVRALLATAPRGSAAPTEASPTYWNSQQKMIERAIIGLRDGWATRKDADDALAALSQRAAAPVSGVEAAARAMAKHAGWEGWDTATDCTHTLSGNDPEDERESWRELAQVALMSVAPTRAAVAASQAAPVGELPPLPEPKYCADDLTDIFTAEQMHDYARAAVAAAKVPTSRAMRAVECIKAIAKLDPRATTVESCKAVAQRWLHENPVTAPVEQGQGAAPSEKAARSIDALDGMGFTYDDEIGWLPPKGVAPVGAGVVPEGALYQAALLAVERMRGCAATYIEDHSKDSYPGAAGLRPQDVATMWAKEIHGIDAKVFLDEAIAECTPTAATAHPVAADDQVRDQALEDAASVAETIYRKDAFRFEIGTDAARAIRALKSRTTAHGGAQEGGAA